MQRSELRIALVIIAGTVLLGACNVLKTFQSPDDNAIVSQVQAKLFEDTVLKTRDIHVASQKGVVTLTGTVSTDLEKAAAERLTSQVDGVKQVVNQLNASPAAATPAPAEAPRRRARRASPDSGSSASSDAAESAPASTVAESAPPAPPAASSQAAAPAAAPAPPEPQRLAIPAGTVITVRMIDSIDSSRNRPGEEFAATVDNPVVVGDKVVIPRSSDARVRLVQSRSAGHMTGQSELQLELVSVVVGGNTYPVQSSYFEKAGASRGKRTAETVGGGAGLGALIGAIAGHGKGAAIGAAIGAGAGTAVQAGTHGEQVRVPSETKLDFTLKSPVTITL